MSAYGYSRCPTCGISVANNQMDGHTCDPEAVVALFIKEIEEKLDPLLEEWGKTKLAQFYQWLELR